MLTCPPPPPRPKRPALLLLGRTGVQLVQLVGAAPGRPAHLPAADPALRPGGRCRPADRRRRRRRTEDGGRRTQEPAAGAELAGPASRLFDPHRFRWREFTM